MSNTALTIHGITNITMGKHRLPDTGSEVMDITLYSPEGKQFTLTVFSEEILFIEKEEVVEMKST